MKPAWILHELNSEILLEHENQHEINMNPAWLRHEFNTNMVSISVPSNFRDDKFKIVNS